MYDIPGADPGDASGAGSTPARLPAALKKVFWKLSLGAPDRAHPDAAGAFDAVKKAHEQLRDRGAVAWTQRAKSAPRARADPAEQERARRGGGDARRAAPGDEAILRGGDGLKRRAAAARSG